MLYSTQKNITSNAPEFNEANPVVGRYFQYPDQAETRIDEGGLRIKGKFKRSLPHMPLVTIITVCLNSRKTIEQCMKSVFEQTYSNIEYIIIDACSTDGTLDIIKKYQDSVDYFLSETDRGLYHAMNKGLELASGDYILILNSDDWYEKRCVEILIQAKHYSSCDIVCALAQRVGESNKILGNMRSIEFDESIYIRMVLRHETMLVSSAIYNQCGNYFEGLVITADWDFAIRLFQANYTVYEVPLPLLNFRISGVSNTCQDGLMYDRELMFKKFFPFLENNEIRNCLIDRDSHSFPKMENLAKKYINESLFVKALQKYSEEMNKTATFHPGFNKKNYEWSVSLIDNKLPLISLILPFFNSENTIVNCLESICSQSIREIEVICVDDASSDGSALLVEQYMTKDNRIKLFKNKINVGCGASRNVGIKNAKGKYIFNIDADDMIPPKALETLYGCAKNHKSDLVRGAYIKEQTFHGKKNKPTRHSLAGGRNKPIIQTNLYKTAELLTGPTTVEGHWSYLYKRDLVKKCPWPSDLKMGQDALFLVDILTRAKKITIVDQVVYKYLENSSSTMNNFNYQKYMDVLEWRRRAWHVLKDSGLKHVGDFFLIDYPNSLWHERFIEEYKSSEQKPMLAKLIDRVKNAYFEADIKFDQIKTKAETKNFFKFIFDGNLEGAHNCLVPSIEMQMHYNSTNKNKLQQRDIDKRTKSEIFLPSLFWSKCYEAILQNKKGHKDVALSLCDTAESMLVHDKNITKKKVYLDKLKYFINENAGYSPDLLLKNPLTTSNSSKLQIIDPFFTAQTDSNKEEFGIIVYGHTRINTLKSVLESLSKQDALKYTEVWLDGDQGNSELRQKINKTIEIVKLYPVKRLSVQRGNFGFRKMIIIGLLEMCSKYRDILILEDDCFPARDAVSVFREELDVIRNDPKIFSVYGHHFLVESEKDTCTRFQGWGWATTADKLEPILRQLIHCYSMSEETYMEFVKTAFTDEIKRRIDVTAPRQPSHTIMNFFAWDETICLLCALNGLVHRPTKRRVIYNCGMGNTSTHFKNIAMFRKPPFNLILEDEVWEYF